MKLPKFLQKSTKKEPLLPSASSTDKAKSRPTKKPTNESCTSFLLLSMPILACSMILLTLSLPLVINNTNPNESSISSALADHEPAWHILIPLCLASLAGSLVTIFRSVQIGAYHRRLKNEYPGLKPLNVLAATCQILGYLGFLLLAVNVDGEHDRMGAMMYLGPTAVYAALHTILLWKQTEYPIQCKVLSTAVPVGSMLCAVVAAVRREGGYRWEWWGVALQALFVGSFTILFLVDPVDEEVREFLFCGCGDGAGKSEKRSCC